MAQLKEIRTRIASVKSTLQVTSAMKMVSAAKLKKAQDSLVRINAYDENLSRVMKSLLESCENYSNPFTLNNEIEKVLVIIVGSNKGLCGGFNVNIVKHALEHINREFSEQIRFGAVDIYAIGNNISKELHSRGITSLETNFELLENHNFEAIAAFSESLISKFINNNYHRIDIVYNSFKNAAVQILTTEQFLPVQLNQNTEKISNGTNYLYEPSAEELLKQIIPLGLKNHFYRILLESNVAEQGARMVAMQLASDNATDLLKELKTSYNNARQSAITNEIMDITGGSEALRKA